MKRQHPTDPNLFWCPKCKTYKAREEFYRRIDRTLGIAVWCKCCDRQRQIKYRQTHQEQRRANDIKYRQAHPEQRRANNIKYRQAHPEQRRANDIKYRQAHPEQRRAYQMKYRQAHPEQRRAYQMKYYPTQLEYSKRRTSELCDRYIRARLKQSGSIATPETIELKRQLIIAKRTLKQIKQWRKENENESDRNIISKQQRADEETNEVNRRHEETGHGSRCGGSAGM